MEIRWYSFENFAEGGYELGFSSSTNVPNVLLRVFKDPALS